MVLSHRDLKVAALSPCIATHCVILKSEVAAGMNPAYEQRLLSPSAARHARRVK
jgi:hypothetical protein